MSNDDEADIRIAIKMIEGAQGMLRAAAQHLSSIPDFCDEWASVSALHNLAQRERQRLELHRAQSLAISQRGRMHA